MFCKMSRTIIGGAVWFDLSVGYEWCLVPVGQLVV